MQQFPVDEEVVAVVWKRANPRPFEQLTFNSALRRVLGIASGKESEGRAAGGTESQEPTGEAAGSRGRTKAPKADLQRLVQAGLLREREELFLIDYQGNRIKQGKAIVAGGGLQFKSQHYSMSLLAKDLLKEVGFQSDFVRGPAHWVNSHGVSVKALWQELMDREERE
jgi:Arc/MetJ family transcription regulator